MADFSKDFHIAYSEEYDACTIRFRCFDTPNSITVFGEVGQGYELEEVLIDIRRVCLEFHQLWSFSLAGSDIVRINEAVRRVEVDVRTALLLSAMKDFHDKELSFDFTVGSLSFLWKRARRVPSDLELMAAHEHVGAEKVTIEGSTVVKADPFVQVDVGGAAKGFVADSLVALLRQAGVTNAEIDLGGNIYMLGKHPSGRAWRVAVRVPEGIDVERPVVEVCNQSVVTSGSYERFVEIDGKRYQHIVDPQTGYPSDTDLVSVTVVAESSLLADMLATAALLGGSVGLDELSARHPEASFIAITAAGAVVETGFKSMQDFKK